MYCVFSLQKKRLSIAEPLGEAPDKISMPSLPTSPLSTTFSGNNSFNLSNSMGSMSLSGNLMHGSVESQNSSKSHSPSGSLTNTISAGNQGLRATTPSGSDSGDSRFTDGELMTKVRK